MIYIGLIIFCKIIEKVILYDKPKLLNDYNIKKILVDHGKLKPAYGYIFDNKKIEKQYMENLKKLDELHKSDPSVRLGKKLYYLI